MPPIYTLDILSASESVESGEQSVFLSSIGAMREVSANTTTWLTGGSMFVVANGCDKDLGKTFLKRVELTTSRI